MIEKYQFRVQAFEDGVCVFATDYDNAIQAVRMFMAFNDHGLAQYFREVVLLEPNGKMHHKVFDRPRPRESVS